MCKEAVEKQIPKKVMLSKEYPQVSRFIKVDELELKFEREQEE